MKKIISLALVMILLVSLCVPVTASEIEDKNEKVPTVLQTNEKAMPVLENGSLMSIQSEGQNSREQWINDTATILEDTYNQQVRSVNETTNSIVFSFEEPEEVVLETGYIDRVEYVKPESALASSTYNTKITYMYGWGDGYYSLESHAGGWSAIKNLVISVAGLAEKISVYAFAVSVLGIAADYFAPETPVNAENTTQYYFLNRIGQVQDPTTGIWGPYVYVGTRRSFYRTILERSDGYGHYTTLGVEETAPNSLTNPTNFDDVDFKPHYSDTEWILETAVDIFESGTTAHKNVYGWPRYFSETVPAK